MCCNLSNVHEVDIFERERKKKVRGRKRSLHSTTPFRKTTLNYQTSAFCKRANVLPLLAPQSRCTERTVLQAQRQAFSPPRYTSGFHKPVS